MKLRPKLSQKRQWAKNKKAFDRVMMAYNSFLLSANFGLAAMQYGDNSGVRCAAKPRPIDFIVDVDVILEKCVKDSRFYLVYVSDIEDEISIGMRAQAIFGAKMHPMEQKIGAVFIKRGLFPLRGRKGYFNTIRRKKNENHN